MILITGASGTVGRELVTLLSTAGAPTRALTRDPAKAQTWLPKGVEVSKGDLTDVASLQAALAGVERVFSLSTGPDLAAHEANLATAAKRAGVKHLVKLSTIIAGAGTDIAIARWHEAGEKAIQDSGLAWTFVRPGIFMSNALQWAGPVKSLGKVFLPYGTGRAAVVHPRDIAAVAAQALTGSGHEGKAYPVTGGEALQAAEMVETLAQTLGRPIEYVPLTEELARERMVAHGIPPLVAQALLQITAPLREGKAEPVLPTVEQIVGRKPLTWRQWTRENVGAFA